MRILRDSFLDHMTFAGFERPILVELFGPLVGLEAEWRAQGATPAELDLNAFDFDYVTRVGLPCATGLLGGVAVETLEETIDHVIARDSLGRVTKLYKQVASIPLPLTHPVHDMDSWLAIRPWYTFSEDRFPDGWQRRMHAARAEGHLIVAGIPGGFDVPRQLMGEEAACLAFYDQPELLVDILATAEDTALRVLERASAEVPIDVLSVHEDLAGKSGSLVGPKLFAQLITPYYQRIWDLLRERGTRLFQQDSDGNLKSMLTTFCDAGINASLPVECSAGMDLVALRHEHGTRLAMYGGLDKLALRHGRAAIDRELEAKLVPLRAQPGLVLGLDHRIPPGTPLADYRYYVDTAREILGLPPRRADGGVWQRMAF